MGARFRAVVAEQVGEEVRTAVCDWSEDQLMPGEVTIEVAYSSVNFKDGLASRPNGGVARISPLIVGIDLAGVVRDSTDARYQPGDSVLVHGYELGMSHHGGLAELARVPADWVVPLPDGLSARQAMAIGTAGFTAAMSLDRLELHGLRPDHGPVLVTGAAGGVGSTAVAIFAQRGYEVVASSGRPEAHAYLRALGAAEVLGRAETSAESARPLEKARWAAAVDPVGGATLAYVLRTMKYGGAVALSGVAGGGPVSTTVYPFILRSVSVLGIDSGQLGLAARTQLWQRLAGELRPPLLEESISRQIGLDEAPAMLAAILRGAIQGRVIVAMGT